MNPTVNRDECWLWAGGTDKSDYGTVSYWYDGRVMAKKAHRVMYEYFVGEVPKGKELDHTCNTPRCINPDHLQPLTHRENMRKLYKPNHCNRGHELTPDNVYTYIKNKKTGRIGVQCKTCHSNKSALRYGRTRKFPIQRVNSHIRFIVAAMMLEEENLKNI